MTVVSALRDRYGNPDLMTKEQLVAALSHEKDVCASAEAIARITKVRIAELEKHIESRRQ